MRVGGLSPRILTSLLWAAAFFGGGCGDPPLCQSDVFVAFEQTFISTDADTAAPGVQTDLHIRTSLQAGDVVTLEVLGTDGTSLGTTEAPAAADGSVVFTGVSVPAPRVVLRATGRGTCGEGRDEITVDVFAGAECSVLLTPAPEVNAYYGPLGVLSTKSDPDPATPGYQTSVRVMTHPGFRAEIFQTTAGEQSLGVVTAGSDGVATLPVTLLDGQVELRATCRGAGAQLASPATTVFVDTTPPTCALVAPAPGTEITPAQDADQDPANGLQLAVAAHADGADVAGEPVALTITPTDGASITVAAADVDGTGTSTAAASVPLAPIPAVLDVSFAMHDHAGNLCTATATYGVVYKGCAIAVTSPSAPVTHDLDGNGANGSQVDVTLAVDPACAGRTVTSTCGSSSPSGTVGPDGLVTLRADICATSPCQIEVGCAFRVTAPSGLETEADVAIVFDDHVPVTDLAAAAVDRQHVQLTWTSPPPNPLGGALPAAYLVKASPVPFTDASFDTTGTVVATATPGAPGSPEGVAVPARTGAAQHFAIATIDGAGHRSAVAVAGPSVPVFDQTGAITPPNATLGKLGFGSAIAHGKFNDDEFDDVAISAPGQDFPRQAGAGAVYVYFGGPLGVAATPDLAITGVATGASLGAGLTAVRWSSATRDDLVIGAPGADGGSGRIFLFRGGAGFGTGTRAATAADLQISVSAAQPGWFANSGLGSVLVTADVDGDGTVDLVASAPRGGTTGGAVILYGGTVTGNVALSDLDAGAANGAIVELFADPGPTPGRRLGFYLHAVGPTLGSLDATDDLVIAYADDYATAGDSLYVVRGDGTRPASAGVTVRPFAPGRDVRLDFVTQFLVTEWASQVTSIDDQNGDGARDLVIGAYRSRNGHGEILIVSGNVLGTGGVAGTTDPGVTLTTITATGAVGGFGAAIATHDQASRADIDGDGREDLLIGGLSGATGRGFVWFGGTIPRGATTTASAPYSIAAPATFKFGRQSPQGFGGQARWIGDINQDGLDDVCWASPFDNSGDGSFEVLWDAR